MKNQKVNLIQIFKQLTYVSTFKLSYNLGKFLIIQLRMVFLKLQKHFTFPVWGQCFHFVV